jgi:hypothetical protein
VQRDLVRELAQLVRHAEPDGGNIGPFVAEHARELAHLLRSDERELQAAAHERDDALVDCLRVRLELALELEREERVKHCIERAHHAARELARTARWFELGIVLDVDVVLGDLLADPKTRFISFALPDRNVVVPTALVRRARPLRRVYLDLACFVDERGIRLRWKGGRGQLNVYAAEPSAQTEHNVLDVALPPRVERRPALLGDVLAGIGFGA